MIQPLLEKLEQTFEAVLDAHVTYILKKGAGLDEEIHTHWMDQRQTEHDAVVNAAKVVLGLADETGAPVEEAEDPEVLRDELVIQGLRIGTQLGAIITAIEGDLGVEQHRLLTEQALQMQSLLMDEYRPGCIWLRNLLPDEAEGLKTAHDADLREVIPKVENQLIALRAKAPRDAVQGLAPQNLQVQPGGQGVQGLQGAGPGAVQRKAGIQMTRLEAPKFDGKARSYLRFKQRFDELVGNQFDQMAQLEYLEKGLPPKVKDKLTMVQKTPQQVREQLDTLYSCTRTPRSC